MALNPFFLQGSPGEQRLVQDLINEHLKIHGIDITYIPRKFVRKETILREVTSSKFNDNFTIEAYVNTYDGYSGQGDILSKFGMSLKDEVSLTISKERFEDFISPFLGFMDANEIELSTRPREGDLIYFPLGQRLFEVKFVEHEQPFYQLGTLYMYELKCELFQYEDEVIDTSLDEIDTLIQDEGFITTLNLVGLGQTATATAVLSSGSSGYIRKIYLNNDGSGYTSTPTVSISTAPSGPYAVAPSAVAITTSLAGVFSVKEIQLTNAGDGYSIPPLLKISGGNGTGAAATVGISTGYGVIQIVVNSGGSGYTTTPTVTIASPAGVTTATATAILNANGSISAIRITDSGVGFTTSPSVTISPPTIISGIGTYIFNEIVTGSISQTKARVKSWDKDTKILKVSYVGIGSTIGGFVNGDIIVGQESGASYANKLYVNNDVYDKYSENDEIETAADLILDFSESNPFGVY